MEKVVRTGDMHPNRALVVYVTPDQDITLLVIQDGGCIGGADVGNPQQEVAEVEFCLSGGRSPHTRKALFKLMAAIEKDNKKYPIEGQTS